MLKYFLLVALVFGVGIGIDSDKKYKLKKLDDGIKNAAEKEFNKKAPLVTKTKWILDGFDNIYVSPSGPDNAIFSFDSSVSDGSKVMFPRYHFDVDVFFGDEFVYSVTFKKID